MIAIRCQESIVLACKFMLGLANSYMWNHNKCWTSSHKAMRWWLALNKQWCVSAGTRELMIYCEEFYSCPWMWNSKISNFLGLNKVCVGIALPWHRGSTSFTDVVPKVCQSRKTVKFHIGIDQKEWHNFTIFSLVKIHRNLHKRWNNFTLFKVVGIMLVWMFKLDHYIYWVVIAYNGMQLFIMGSKNFIFGGKVFHP